MALDGEAYYRAAISLTDKHRGRRFCDMMGEDYLVGGAMRQYFVEDFRDLELFGWNAFCEQMRADGQKDWLAKIKALDDDVVLSYLERQILNTASGGRENRMLLESAVKALQGLASAAKIQADNENNTTVAPPIEVLFVPSLNKPIEPEEWEEILAKQDPDLVKYFGLKNKGDKQ